MMYKGIMRTATVKASRCLLQKTFALCRQWRAGAQPTQSNITVAYKWSSLKLKESAHLLWNHSLCILTVQFITCLSDLILWWQMEFHWRTFSYKNNFISRLNFSWCNFSGPSETFYMRKDLARFLFQVCFS